MQKLLSQWLILLLFIAVSVFLGWNIPAFYKWTDSDQSRPSPLLWQVPVGLAIGSLALCVALPWLPIASKHTHDTSRTPVRFGLRTLLLTTIVVAVATALIAKFPLVASGILCAGAYVYLIGFGVRYPQHRLASATLVACMILPYAWVVAYNELDRILPTLVIMIGGMPAFVPALLVSGMFGQPFQESQWLAFLLAAVEVVVGIWAIRLGPKRTIAYLLLVVQLSLLGSLAFYQLIVA